MLDGNYNLEVFVGDQIRARRLSQGISLTQLAEATGCPIQEIEEYEMGRKRTPPERLWDFAHKLNVPLSYFFAEIGRREAPRWATETKTASETRIG